ncbi:cysteine desulfurase family protein [Oceanivirga miroungae]|uniref:cysteine desulfurase n=1 Tax=Oceanivirga miroungae TaxID=1130046 RepID=A0A6I8M8G8_9FUSO|nr:cysteine desulfurase family protein [Oceanivirga miroungae]VWL85804.1 class V aminotransferase [Oceanivirga miroungae]
MKKIYLDNAATTKASDRVITEMINSMKNDFANANSIHDFGNSVSKKIKEKKKIFEKILKVPSEDVYFTAGGTDSNNILIKGIAKAHKNGRIITTKIEHPSILETTKSLEEEYEVIYLDVNEYGEVLESSLVEAMTDDTILVSISYVNSELGIIQDIKKLSETVKRINKNTIFHTDFVQGLSHIDVDFSKLNVDAISMSSHKIHGPKGIGALYLKKNTKFKNMVYGKSNDNILVPRTLANELIIGFLEAMEEIDYANIKKVEKLKEYTLEKLKDIKDIRINSKENASPYILNIAFKNARGEAILNYLSSFDIYISTGSACSSRIKVSNVISAINLSKEYIDGVIRISFSKYNEKEEIDYFIEKLKEVLEMMV